MRFVFQGFFYKHYDATYIALSSMLEKIVCSKDVGFFKFLAWLSKISYYLAYICMKKD